jgi:predicted secreted protein
MNVFTGIILYMMIYWVAIFAVLPFGNKAPEVVEEGNVHSAPENPHLLGKFIATGIVAAILWLIVFVLIKMDVIDFYDIAKHMSEEDLAK